MDPEVCLQCYNKGCGEKFDPNANTDDSCCHHPGAPVFHDAYKGWSCCNKKCTDFTEFLNIKGCTKSKHSNVKPPEPEPQPKMDVDINEVIEVKPVRPVAKQRPPFDSPMAVKTPEIAASLRQQVVQEASSVLPSTIGIPIGTPCKNGGCGRSYAGPESEALTCQYHPGVPVFHEGLKFWSCCLKRTTDFNAFLSQPGCETGIHLWSKKNEDESVECRWDYHQTASHVVVAVYAKQYCPKASTVKLNPIRLVAVLQFPGQSNRQFQLDMELNGIVDVEASHVTFFGTKVEIKLKKAEAGKWSQLDIPRMKTDETKEEVPKSTPEIEEVDLDDL